MAGLTHQDALQKFKQAKKGLLTLTVRTRLTAPRSPSGHLSPPLCRSLSSGSCAAKDGGPFLVGDAEAAASARTPSYRVLVEVSLTKGRRGSGHRPVQRAPLPVHLRHLRPHALAGVGGAPGRAAAVRRRDRGDRRVPRALHVPQRRPRGPEPLQPRARAHHGQPAPGPAGKAAGAPGLGRARAVRALNSEEETAGFRPPSLRTCPRCVR
ncbi:interleukin 16 [Phyllostomus discolor]|uniref:Interleukin 16 n=1 Tax=Phyllostomus discolor TaxID=89673 RepID=A0A834DGN7_9CHIR|nr:interleukin 16 [Phyllostomus discolor]